MTCPTVDVFVACALGLLVGGCQSTPKESCFCDNAPAVTILAPAGAVLAMKLGGDACKAALPSCVGTVGDAYPVGCAETMLFPRQAGACDIEIDLVGGRVERRSVDLVENATCCGGVRAASTGGGTIVLTGPDAGPDGG